MAVTRARREAAIRDRLRGTSGPEETSHDLPPRHAPRSLGLTIAGKAYKVSGCVYSASAVNQQIPVALEFDLVQPPMK